MNRERHNVESNDRNRREQARRREALQVLLEARERLMGQMMDDILERREALHGVGGDGYTTFELEEIEDRYTTRLQAINALLENLEYRQPAIRYEVETFSSSLKALKKDLAAALDAYDQWDLVNVNVVPGRGEEVTVVLTFTADEYPED